MTEPHLRVVDVTEHDLDVLVRCTVRYALGRGIYMPQYAVEMARKYATPARLREAKREVREWLAEDWHDHPQREVWEQFVKEDDS